MTFHEIASVGAGTDNRSAIEGAAIGNDAHGWEDNHLAGIIRILNVALHSSELQAVLKKGESWSATATVETPKDRHGVGREEASATKICDESCNESCDKSRDAVSGDDAEAALERKIKALMRPETCVAHLKSIHMSQWRNDRFIKVRSIYPATFSNGFSAWINFELDQNREPEMTHLLIDHRTAEPKVSGHVAIRAEYLFRNVRDERLRNTAARLLKADSVAARQGSGVENETAILRIVADFDRIIAAKNLRPLVTRSGFVTWWPSSRPTS